MKGHSTVATAGMQLLLAEQRTPRLTTSLASCHTSDVRQHPRFDSHAGGIELLIRKKKKKKQKNFLDREPAGLGAQVVALARCVALSDARFCPASVSGAVPS